MYIILEESARGLRNRQEVHYQWERDQKITLPLFMFEKTFHRAYLYKMTLFPIVHSDDQTWHDNVQCPISGLVFFDKKKNLDASLLLKLIYIFCQVKRKKSSDFLTCYFSPFFAQWKKQSQKFTERHKKIQILRWKKNPICQIFHQKITKQKVL